MESVAARLRRSPQLWLAALVARVALAALLVPTGLTKLLGQPFQRRSLEPWAMPFFDMLYSAGVYWRFVGLLELGAGLLLLAPRFATLGALASLAISAQLVAITVSLRFRWTAVFATALMLAASAALLLWDWPRVAALVAPASPPGGSARAALAAASRRRGVRIAAAAAIGLWVLLHALDRVGRL